MGSSSNRILSAQGLKKVTGRKKIIGRKDILNTRLDKERKEVHVTCLKLCSWVVIIYTTKFIIQKLCIFPI